MYLALGIVFLIICIVMAGVIVFTTVRSIKNGGEMITKKNLFYLAPSFLLLYFMYITAAVFKGDKLDFFYCFALVNTIFDVLKFKATTSVIAPICSEYALFYADFVIAYLLGVITVILSVASFFSRRISNFISVTALLKKDCDIVIGDSAEAIKYIKRTKKCLLLGADIKSQRYAELIKQGIPVVKVAFEAKQLSRKLKRGGYNVIVFKDGSYSYTKIIDTFTELADKERIKIYLEANQQEMKILKEKFITKADKISNLYIAGFSKYELMARRFVVDYPITKFIPRAFFNENFTLKNDKRINVVFVGFGKVNYQLFRMCAMQFQFAQEIKGKLAVKPVNYYIYDNKCAMLHNEFFSRILYEVDEVFADCDFPKPENICNVNIRPVDINSVEAKKEFKELVGEDSFTYFIISLDDDLPDASYAQTVKRLFDNSANYRIFVRAKNDSGEKFNELNDGIVYFGEEKKLYTHENIVNDDLTELAQRINILYNNISDPPEWLKDLKKKKDISADEKRKILNDNLSKPENKQFMLESWSELPYIEQASNLYHALNLPFKLNLLGFDMVKKSGEGACGATEEEFNERYINSGRDKDYEDYAFFFKNEVSNVLAFIEHSRWNALYILYDYKQMKKAEMKVFEDSDGDGKVRKTMPHKDTERKQHACLTTYYGLDELIKYKFETLYPTAEFKNDSEAVHELSKIYRYDYMDLDRLYGEVTSMGYVLK
ncbi:MAG: hypothetical protein K2K39_00595 [Clostridia bacterium]|nr:hypothetical protein [Clostridia bacterium]